MLIILICIILIMSKQKQPEPPKKYDSRQPEIKTESKKES